MKLPDSFENKSQLKNMKVGQQGYIVPWGMWVHSDGQCYLNEEYTFSQSPGGTVSLKITRVNDGYVAHIHEMTEKHKWERQEQPSYMSPKEMCYGKVVGFGREEIKMPNIFSSAKAYLNSIFCLIFRVFCK